MLFLNSIIMPSDEVGSFASLAAEWNWIPMIYKLIKLCSLVVGVIVTQRGVFLLVFTPG